MATSTQRTGKATGVTLTDGVDLWERQKGESLLRYGQFRTYRDLGVNRTLRATAEVLGKSYDHIRHVAAAFLWTDRAAAWDAHLVAQFTARWGDERIKAAERDARLLQALTVKAAEGLRALNASALSPGELLRLIDVLLRHSRALFGDPAAVQTAAGMFGAETGDGHPLVAEIAAFAGMSPAARKARLVELTQQAEARAAALSGADDD